MRTFLVDGLVRDGLVRNGLHFNYKQVRDGQGIEGKGLTGKEGRQVNGLCRTGAIAQSIERG